MGFKKRSEGIFTKDLSDGFLGWLGFNHASKKQGIEINPVVGVRCQKLEQMLSLLLDEKPHKYAPPTVSISLGYLMPGQNYRSWVFGNDRDDAVLLDLVDAIRCYGLPFMESSSEISQIETLLGLPKFGHAEQVMYRRPLAKWLLGDRTGAFQLLSDYNQLLGQRTDMAAERFRNFGRSFESFGNQVGA